MTPFAQIVAEARRCGDWSRLLAAVPYASFIGLSAATAEDGTMVVCLTYRPENVGNPRVPALHGGVIAALMESAMVLKILERGETTALPKVVNFTTEFYRPAGLVDTMASAEIVRHGRRLSVLRAVAWQADPARPIAGGYGHVVP